MGFRVLPLIHADDHEQRGHGEVDARGVEGDQLPGQGAQDGARHPVALVEQGDEQRGHVPFPVREVLGPGHGTQQGVGLVGQGEYHIRVGFFHLFKALDKGQAVECVAAVDEQGHHRGGDEAESTGENAHQGELHGTGVDAGADEKGPQRSQTRLL